MVVADVGAGSGYLTTRLARLVGPTGKVYATDIQPAMLRAIQEKHGYLPAGELRALSERTHAPLYQLQGVASFFPHFRLAPPRKKAEPRKTRKKKAPENPG